MTNLSTWPVHDKDQVLLTPPDAELLPCPSCNQPPTYMVRRYEGRVECSFCRTYGQWHEQRESAAAEWNARKQLDRDVQT